MKKINTYIAIIPIVVLALMPPLGMYVPFTEKIAWVWLVLIFGFLGLSTIFLNISPYIKALAALCFINTFFSKTPFISQFSYIEIVGCVYLYWICRRVEDWSLVFRALWVILAMNIILLTLQHFGKDNLLNFGFFQSSHVGLVGNFMMFKSCMLVLVALLLQSISKIKYNVRAIAVFTFMIAAIYFSIHRVYWSFLFARGPIWLETIHLAMKHPFIGWGIGSYKAIFASIAVLPHATITEGRWISCHNDWLQVLFELGIPGFTLLIAYAISLLLKCRGVLLYGALLIGFTMSVHFPMRTTQIVPLLVLFAAYIERIDTCRPQVKLK